MNALLRALDRERDLRAEVERLKAHPCRDGAGSCRTETPLDLCAACALVVEVERLRGLVRAFVAGVETGDTTRAYSEATGESRPVPRPMPTSIPGPGVRRYRWAPTMAEAEAENRRSLFLFLVLIAASALLWCFR